MKKVIVVTTKWNRAKKSGTYNLHCGDQWSEDIRIEKTTPDDLHLLAMNAAVKKYGQPGDELHFYVKNSRVRNAIAHPATSVHGDAGRLFKATVKQQRCSFRIHA